MANDPKLGIAITPEFVANHVNLYKPTKYNDAAKEAWSFFAMFPVATDILELKQKAKAVAVAEWGEGGLTDVRFPFKNGDKYADYLLETSAREHAAGKVRNGKLVQPKTEDQVKVYRGNVLLKAKSYFAPSVVDRAANEIIDQSAVYSGIKGRAEVNFKAKEVDGKKYVTVYFNFFMKTGDGARLAGRDAKSVFKGLLGGQSNDDPTAGGDIPID